MSEKPLYKVLIIRESNRTVADKGINAHQGKELRFAVVRWCVCACVLVCLCVCVFVCICMYLCYRRRER